MIMWQVDLDWCHTARKSSSVLLVCNPSMWYLADRTRKAQSRTSMSECSWKVLSQCVWEWYWLWGRKNRRTCGLTDPTQSQDGGHTCNQVLLNKCQNSHHAEHWKSCRIDQSWRQSHHTNHDIVWWQERTHKTCHMSGSHQHWDTSNMDWHKVGKVDWFNRDTESKYKKNNLSFNDKILPPLEFTMVLLVQIVHTVELLHWRQLGMSWLQGGHTWSWSAKVELMQLEHEVKPVHKAQLAGHGKQL